MISIIMISKIVTKNIIMILIIICSSLNDVQNHDHTHHGLFCMMISENVFTGCLTVQAVLRRDLPQNNSSGHLAHPQFQRWFMFWETI